VAHGLSNAMLLPAVTRFSISGAPGRYADCARQLGAAERQDSDEAAAAKLIEFIDTLCGDVEVPTPSTYGIDAARWEELIPLMAQQALASGSPSNNPVVPTAEEIAELYRKVF
ncbi:MAG: iron-containing alcohol dehydrogenase, partial [Rhodococcus sp. (in: high G+C Gram-positive bacteria)]